MEAVEEKMIKRHSPNLIGHDRLFQLEDVLINVLSWLPVKTLFRFRCVCKRWRYLISNDPYFLRLHSQHSKSKQPLLLFSSTPADSRDSISLKSIDREKNPISRFEVKFENSYNILLPTRFDLVCIYDDANVHICNPSTHEFITLPKPPPACYPSVGFGYVQSTGQYKVVRLSVPDYGLVDEDDEILSDDEAALFRTKCQVFTLGVERRGSSSCSCCSCVWRDVEDSPYDVRFVTRPAFVKGAIHWLVDYHPMIDAQVYHGHMIDPNYTIIAFDVECEEFRLVPHPEGGCPDPRSLQSTAFQLVELRGLLCLSHFKGSKMDIWMFKDYYYESGNDRRISGTWVKEYSIDLNVLYRRYRMGKCFSHYYTPRDIEDTKVLIETHLKGLGYYDLQSTSFKGLMHSREMPKLQFSFYVESLRPLKQLAQNCISYE
ncbi:F-box protein At3g07870-like [Telopea speciosissima]|uniref:F-box protein At3g07870-like n=1 Tax=Telopea speciosissima TaxID=54955 RepID=UPI001CC382BB|nr:F-box protein At3g07870-like [Telopea speciosissima]